VEEEAIPEVSRRPRLAVDLRAAVRSTTGIGVYTLELLRELARQGEFDLLAVAHREPAAAPELRAMGVAVEWQPAPLGVLWQQFVLPRRLARGDVDLFWSPLLTLPRRLPVPGVVTLHDLAALHVPETMTAKVRWSLLPFLQPTVELARRIVVERAFPAARGKVRVIPHGVAPEFAPADGGRIAALRARRGAPRGWFLAAGTVEPRKNLGLLLDAWEALRREQPEAALPLVAVGPSGWKSRALERRLERLAPAGVERLGRVPQAELVGLFQGAAALVYPSIYEGFGLPVAEAIACGVPVVVAAGTSPEEVAGDAGLAVDPDDAAALAAAMARLATEPGLAEQLAANARRRASRFRWEDAAAALAALFREVLAEARR
jgi:glycosyltransferase involved in cell wall biosynthesis